MGEPGPMPIPEPRLAYEDLWTRFMNALSGMDALEAQCAALQARVATLEDFVDRYRKTWTGAHREFAGTHRAGCLVCEADRLLGGETR